MDIFNIASALFGSSRIEDSGGLSNAVDSVSAVGATASVDGSVGITMDADVTPADDIDGEDTDQTIIDVPTSPAVDVEDDLILGLTGDGPLKVPVVLANPGSGDRQQAQINSAVGLAEAAEAVANATGQHFWTDGSGVHVTEVTQDEWEDADGSNYHSGANVLINSLGQLFRNGLNNLLTLTTENGARALTIWDGLGNAASNIVARFGSTIQFGSDTDPLMHIAAGIITMYPGDDYEAINFASDGTANVHYNVITGNVGIHSPQTITMTPANGSNGFSTAAGTVLWSSGGWAMAANQTANLAYNVSTCPTGIVLHWQPYMSSTVRNYYHHWQFVPKEQVASFAGTTVDVTLSSSKFASIATKTLYVSDNRVTGHADNAATGTANGITYANSQWVLTQIIAV